jgi:hypothetical protein
MGLKKKIIQIFSEVTEITLVPSPKKTPVNLVTGNIISKPSLDGQNWFKTV